MRQVVTRVGAIILFFALAGCASTQNGAALMGGGGPVALEVGDCSVYCQRISVAEVQQRFNSEFGPPIREALAQGQTRDALTQLIEQQNLRGEFVNQLVFSELMTLEARRLGVGVDPASVDAAVAQTTGEVDPAAVAQLRVSRARSQLAYETAARLITANQYRARIIQVASQADANRVLARLQSGEAFDALAREFSQEPTSATEGGELGWLAQGVFLPEVEQVALDPATALNTPLIVPAQNAFFVLEVQERQANRPFDSLEQLRKAPTAQQLYDEWFAQYRQNAETSGQLKLLLDPTTLAIPFPVNIPL